MPKFDSRKLAAAAIGGPLTVVAFFALLLVIAPRAQAQTESVLYDFCAQPNCSDGYQPSSGVVSDGQGNFYGTTYYGGLGFGTVFQLSLNGNGGWNDIVIHIFTGLDGAEPYGGLIFDGAGNLYGTTIYGGPNGHGVVFRS